jgi:hypothetical protein
MKNLNLQKLNPANDPYGYVVQCCGSAGGSIKHMQKQAPACFEDLFVSEEYAAF